MAQDTLMTVEVNPDPPEEAMGTSAWEPGSWVLRAPMPSGDALLLYRHGSDHFDWYWGLESNRRHYWNVECLAYQSSWLRNLLWGYEGREAMRSIIATADLLGLECRFAEVPSA
jgi:hypothetical protein